MTSSFSSFSLTSCRVSLTLQGRQDWLGRAAVTSGLPLSGFKVLI